MVLDGLVHAGVVSLLMEQFRWAGMLPMFMDVSLEELLRSWVSRASVIATPAQQEWEPGEVAEPAETALAESGSAGAVQTGDGDVQMPQRSEMTLVKSGAESLKSRPGEAGRHGTNTKTEVSRQHKTTITTAIPRTR